MGDLASSLSSSLPGCQLPGLLAALPGCQLPGLLAALPGSQLPGLPHVGSSSTVAAHQRQPRGTGIAPCIASCAVSCTAFRVLGSPPYLAIGQAGEGKEAHHRAAALPDPLGPAPPQHRAAARLPLPLPLLSPRRRRRRQLRPQQRRQQPAAQRVGRGPGGDVARGVDLLVHHRQLAPPVGGVAQGEGAVAQHVDPGELVLLEESRSRSEGQPGAAMSQGWSHRRHAVLCLAACCVSLMGVSLMGVS